MKKDHFYNHLATADYRGIAYKTELLDIIFGEVERLDSLRKESIWLDQHLCDECERLQQDAYRSDVRCEKWNERYRAYDAERSSGTLFDTY